MRRLLATQPADAACRDVAVAPPPRPCNTSCRWQASPQEVACAREGKGGVAKPQAGGDRGMSALLFRLKPAFARRAMVVWRLTARAPAPKRKTERQAPDDQSQA